MHFCDAYGEIFLFARKLLKKNDFGYIIKNIVSALPTKEVNGHKYSISFR